MGQSIESDSKALEVLYDDVSHSFQDLDEATTWSGLLTNPDREARVKKWRASGRNYKEQVSAMGDQILDPDIFYMPAIREQFNILGGQISNIGEAIHAYNPPQNEFPNETGERVFGEIMARAFETRSSKRGSTSNTDLLNNIGDMMIWLANNTRFRYAHAKAITAALQEEEYANLFSQVGRGLRILRNDTAHIRKRPADELYVELGKRIHVIKPLTEILHPENSSIVRDYIYY